jgi:hypothetical protein
MKLTTGDNNMIETIIGKSTVVGNKIVENSELKWTFIFPVGTEISAVIDETGGNVSFLVPDYGSLLV